MRKSRMYLIERTVYLHAVQQLVEGCLDGWVLPTGESTTDDGNNAKHFHFRFSKLILGLANLPT